MKRFTRAMLSVATTVGVLGALGGACPSNQSTSPTALDHRYVGSLNLLFTQDLPPISESVTMEVQISRDGRMTFQNGTLQYDGEITQEDMRLRRSGTVVLAPTGSWFNNGGVDQFQVIENGIGEEQLQQWAFDGLTWQLTLDQTIPIAWNGGLAFELADAVMAGSVIEANAGLYRVRWTLALTPALD